MSKATKVLVALWAIALLGVMGELGFLLGSYLTKKRYEDAILIVAKDWQEDYSAMNKAWDESYRRATDDWLDKFHEMNTKWQEKLENQKCPG